LELTAASTYDLLGVLVRHGVEFVVVGMGAAVLQGTPATTADIDILYLVAEENFPKLEAALMELEAEFRADFMNRRLKPNMTHLRAGGHILLRTKLGQLDVLGTIETATRYEDVQNDTIELDIGELKVKVLSLRRVIEAKTKAGRPKDLAMLPVLKATLREIERLQRDPPLDG
jgi:predicted nucleotidyltransferase